MQVDRAIKLVEEKGISGERGCSEFQDSLGRVGMSRSVLKGLMNRD